MNPSFVLPPDHELPDLLIDACLGTIQVLQFFRDAGYGVHTIQEVFSDPGVPDVEWIPRADQEGWAVITKDKTLLRNVEEREALNGSRLRVVCLANQNLGFARQIEYFDQRLKRMARQLCQPGPWFMKLTGSGVEMVSI